jgi:peptide deformylase
LSKVLESKTAKRGAFFAETYLPVERPARCCLELVRRYTSARAAEYTGMAARIVCHEVDHVQGSFLSIISTMNTRAKQNLISIA